MVPNEGTEGEERGKSPIFSRGNGESWLGMAEEGTETAQNTMNSQRAQAFS